MQKTMIIGRIGKDCDVKTVSNKQVGNFSVAVSKKVNGQDQTTWFECALWEKDKIYQYLKKGSQVFCEGEVEVNTYQTSSGENKFSLRLRVFQIELLAGNKDAASVSGGGPATNGAKGAVNAPASNDDDAPF